MTMEVARELDALGEPTTELSRATLGGTMLGLLSRFASTFQSAVEGKGNFVTGREGGREGGIVGGGETLELYGGARINYIFSEIFGKSLMGIDPFATLTDEEIRTAICNANGTRPALFVPEISFDLLVKRQISRLEQVGRGARERGGGGSATDLLPCTAVHRTGCPALTLILPPSVLPSFPPPHFLTSQA